MKDINIFLSMILESIEKIERFVKGYDFDMFEDDEKTIDTYCGDDGFKEYNISGL